jgi:predicted secreted protein
MSHWTPRSCTVDAGGNKTMIQYHNLGLTPVQQANLRQMASDAADLLKDGEADDIDKASIYKFFLRAIAESQDKRSG